MYILKNALKCISRSKGRNILIGLIAFVIALSACLGLSIRQAAESAKADTLEDMTITASISFDRQSMMSGMSRPPEEEGSDSEAGGFDREQFSSMMEGADSLTLEDYETYAEADSVKDFYYTLTASFDGSDDLEPVSTESDSESDTDDSGSEMMPGGGAEMGGFGGGGAAGGRGGMASEGDFTVTGYSGSADAGMGGGAPDDGSRGGGLFGTGFGQGAMDYITEVNSAMNLTVVLQMIGIGLLLTLVASAVSVLFVMRYDPLKILANRD